MFTHSLDLDFHLKVICSRWHVDRLHLEVEAELAIMHEFVQKHWHELNKLIAEESSTLCEGVLDCLVLWIVIRESTLESCGKMLGDLKDIGLEWFFVYCISDRYNDRPNSLDGSGAQFFTLHR